MLEQLTRRWWMLAVRGALAILFAVIAFSRPGITVLALVWLWGAYAFVDGIFTLAASLRAVDHHQHWGILLLEGLSGIAAGIIAFAWPHVTALVLVILIAAWAMVTGIFEIAAAIRLRQMIEHEWLLGLSGVLSILLGVLLVAEPRAGVILWAWTVGAYALFFGIVLLALAFRLRALGERPSSRRAAA
jgi:uncharacterized membrane protein HdeD (DUF308 family)